MHLTLLSALLVSLLLLDDLTQEATAHHIARTNMLINMMIQALLTLGKTTAWQLMMVKALMKESCVLSTGLSLASAFAIGNVCSHEAKGGGSSMLILMQTVNLHNVVLRVKAQASILLAKQGVH